MVSRSQQGDQESEHFETRGTRVQELQLELIELVDRNNCRGKKVAKLLRDNRNLWRAAIMPNESLFPLLDMEDGNWSADTLYILPEKGQEAALEKLVKRFKADEITWISGEQSLEMLGYWEKDIEKNEKLILSVWWD